MNLLVREKADLQRSELVAICPKCGRVLKNGQTASAGVSVGYGLGLLAAALVTALSCIGAGIAVSSSASAAIGALSEKPEIFGKALIFVALAEGVALYGMLISIQILSKL